jgi:hypothetical protein
MTVRILRSILASLTTLLIAVPAAMPSSYGEMTDSRPASYMGCNPQYTIPATPTDMVVFTGSATKTVKIRKIRLFMGQTTAGNEKFYLVKRSTANTGGTATTVTTAALDSTNAAPTAVLKYYTANPSPLGTVVANLSEPTIQTPIGTGGSALYPPWFNLYEWEPGTQPITLRGTGESVALNWGGAALNAGLKVQLEVIWTEE